MSPFIPFIYLGIFEPVDNPARSEQQIVEVCSARVAISRGKRAIFLIEGDFLCQILRLHARCAIAENS